MESLHLALAQPEPELVWGLVARGVGLSFLIAFCSLAPQVLPIAGRAGLLPIAEALRAQARDFAGWRRFAYFPTLLWVNASDRSLLALVGIGVASASSIIMGGPHTPYAFALCWLAYLSLDRALTLIYPWDALLLEAGFWGIFLPEALLLPDFACVSAPNAPTAWAFRLLAFRVLFGFGKHKFAGSKPQDRGFLRGFLVSQPLPTYLGLLAHRAPLAVHVLALYGLFVVEVVAPFTVFFPGPFTTLSAYAVLALMLAIHSFGSYGHFNWILSAVVLSWLDHASARQLTLASLATPAGVVFAAHSGIALLALPFNTFCAFTWTLWAPWRRIPVAPLRWLITLARWLAPFRLVHPYGVFPPQSPPSARFAPVAEVTWDGEHWHELQHRFWPSHERSKPRLCAPHHDRFEQAIVYESIGLNEQSLFRGVVGRWDPYGHGGVSAARRLLHSILAGGAPGQAIYDRSLERQHGSPRAIRVRMHLLEPAPPAEHARDVYWKRELIGPNIPAQTLQDMFVEHPLPPPELWHFEDVVWLYRSRLGRAMRAVQRSESPHALIAQDAPELAAEVEAFWSELVPQLRAADFTDLRARVEALRSQFGRERLYAFERIAGRYSALLFARLDPTFEAAGVGGYLKPGPQALGVDSLYELRLLTHHIIAQGRSAYDAVIAEPASASEHAAAMNGFSAHSLQAIFRYDWLVYECQKLRLLETVLQIQGRTPLTARGELTRVKNEALAKRVFGALTAVEFLKGQLQGSEHADIAENWPRFSFDERAEVIRIRYKRP
jgi:hypothetical protein